jgi:hypothetical protein
MSLAELVASTVRLYGRHGVPLVVVKARLGVDPRTASIAVDDAITFGLVVLSNERLYPTLIEGIRTR